MTSRLVIPAATRTSVELRQFPSTAILGDAWKYPELTAPFVTTTGAIVKVGVKGLFTVGGPHDHIAWGQVVERDDPNASRAVRESMKGWYAVAYCRATHPREGRLFLVETWMAALCLIDLDTRSAF